MVEDVVRERLEIDRGPGGAAFGSVIEHDIEQHADSGVVQCAYALTELFWRSRRVDAVVRMRRVEAAGAVAPVVLQPVRESARGDVLLVEGHHRQELDVGYA